METYMRTATPPFRNDFDLISNSVFWRALAVAVVVLLWATGCGGMGTADSPTCLKLTPVGADGAQVSMPSKVSLFFAVDSCEAQPVAGLDATAFDISEDGAPLNPFESQRTVQPKGQRFAMSSLLLLDMSGSILRGGQFLALKAAAKNYVDTVLAHAAEGQRVGIMTFDGRERPTWLVEFTADPQRLYAGLESLETRECSASADCAVNLDRRSCAGWRCVDDSTNLYGAVVHGVDALEAQRTLDASVVFQESALLIFTDGSDQAARSTLDFAQKRVISTSAHVFSVGLGAMADAKTLIALGKDGFYAADSADGLSRAFETVAGRVNAMANRFYLLEYCSPKRSGKHTVKVTVSASSRTGTLTREFDATGFASGCEL